MTERALKALLLLLLLPACTPLGMIYAHRDTLGLNVSTGVDATAPFQVSLGQSTQMGTYVPVAIPLGNQPVGSTSEKSSDDQQGVQVFSNTLTGAEIVDMFSVYSTFASKAGVQVGSVSVDRGNTFATGVAARRLAEADRAQTCLALENLAEGNKTDATKLAAIRKTIDAVCTGE